LKVIYKVSIQANLEYADYCDEQGRHREARKHRALVKFLSESEVLKETPWVYTCRHSSGLYHLRFKWCGFTLLKDLKKVEILNIKGVS
jgi:hypothetical protein